MRPILFSLGPISISSFGFFAAIAFLLTAFLAWKFSQEELLFSKTPIKEDTLFDAIFLFILGTLFGARLIFILSHFEQFGFSLLRFVLIRDANGFSFLGGFLMGTLFLISFALKKGLNFWHIADIFSLAASAALSLIFTGAFLDGVGVGARTTFPWGVLVVGHEGRRHPVQLLAAAFFLFCFLILKKVRFFVLKKRLKEGIVSLCFLALSGFVLFILDFLKEGEIYFKILKRDQITYLGLSLISGLWLYQRLERNLRSDLRLIFQFLSSFTKISKRKHKKS